MARCRTSRESSKKEEERASEIQPPGSASAAWILDCTLLLSAIIQCLKVCTVKQTQRQKLQGGKIKETRIMCVTLII